MTVGSLFSGLDGFAYAAEAMGWPTLFHCEKNKYLRDQLARKYPGSTIYGDCKKVDWTVWRGQIDLLCFGDPCQPSSVAGKRLGAGDARFLWPEGFRAVEEIRPAWVVNENVEGSISNGLLDKKIVDLEGAGYTCWPPLLIPAGAVGAIHQRNRVWLVADADGRGCGKLNASSQSKSHPARKPGKNPRRAPRLGPHTWHTDKSRLLRLADGSAAGVSRKDRYRQIAAYGNAIVWQIAFALFQEIQAVSSHAAP